LPAYNTLSILCKHSSAIGERTISTIICARVKSTKSFFAPWSYYWNFHLFSKLRLLHIRFVWRSMTSTTPKPKRCHCKLKVY